MKRLLLVALLAINSAHAGLADGSVGREDVERAKAAGVCVANAQAIVDMSKGNPRMEVSTLVSRANATLSTTGRMYGNGGPTVIGRAYIQSYRNTAAANISGENRVKLQTACDQNGL